LTLNLKQDLDTFKGRGDDGCGDGRESTGGAYLANAVLAVDDGAGRIDELLAQIVALRFVSGCGDSCPNVIATYPEADGDCGFVSVGLV
jgi:hypothetical protein